MGDRDDDCDNTEAHSPGISVSEFDYSVENHFKAMDKISNLSGESDVHCDQTEIQQLFSSITFLREWRHFCYQPQAIRFASQSETPQKKDVIDGINLPQFSSAAVPKMDVADGNKVSSHLSKDFVMYVGGLVWGLDWCPRVHQSHDTDINVEFIAVAVHPPESLYHKIGAPLTGRGVIQIWCLLNADVKDQDVNPCVNKKPKKYKRSNELKATQAKKPKGRPRKYPRDKSLDMQALVVQNQDDPIRFLHSDGISHDTLEQVSIEDTDRNVKSSAPHKPRGRPKKKSLKESVDNSNGSNLELHRVKLLEYSLKTDKILLGNPQKVSDEDTYGDRNASAGVSTEQQPNSTDTENCNPVESVNPKGSPKKRRIEEPLAIEFPQDSSKLLAVDDVSLETSKIVAEEDNCRNHSGLGAGVSPGHQKQHPEGSNAKVFKLSEPQKPRRPRKKSGQAVENSNCSNQHVQALAVQLTEDSSKMLPEDEIPCKTHEHVAIKDSSRKRKVDDKGYTEKSGLTASKSRLTKCQTRIKDQVNGTDLPLISQNDETALQNSETFSGCHVKLTENIVNPVLFETDPNEDVALPRLVMCLAHNGKVAWDVKWRPLDSYSNSKHRMGYLSVLLGSGALEVWEVPLPHATKAIFSACQKEGTDPRFMKLEPVFRCSMLKCGDRQSIPLTVEWSTSSPHDLILAGCHDGMVALWKFSPNGPSKDTRPLLCFSADTLPIRVLAWAPIASDPESANIIVTAGHKGVKFWDLRDPFHPLWSINTPQKMIYSLDWLPDPRCIVLSYDDGEIRIISLLKAACDVPVTGTPFVCSLHQGLYSYYCSSSSIWSVQVSRLTGMVAYCCSDGTVLCFQLTTKAVEKDPRRNREPHYLCGSLTLEESTLTVFSPLPDIPFPMKKSSNEWTDTPRSRRRFISNINQEKRAKKQMENCPTPEDQGQALCYGNDPRNDSGPDDTLLPDKSKQTKSNVNENPKTDTNQALVCIDEAIDSYKSKEESAKKCPQNDDKKETFPPKMVAIHRVRWNMNKGSERWMCYGGAAGIVRCQEIKP